MRPSARHDRGLLTAWKERPQSAALGARLKRERIRLRGRERSKPRTKRRRRLRTRDQAPPPLFLPLSRPPSARIPFQMTTGQPRAHRRRPRRGAHRRHRPRCRLWYVNIDQEKKKNFSTRGRKPPTTKRFLLVFTLSPRFLCSPRSSCMPFQLSYKTRHRLRQVHLHAPHDGRLRRRPRAPGR